MSNRVCRDCRAIYNPQSTGARNGRCSDCTRAYRRDHPEAESPTTQKRTKAERARRAAAVTAWVSINGWTCPGWQRDPHPSHDLTADHVTPVAHGGINGPLRILCRSCNSSRGAKG